MFDTIEKSGHELVLWCSDRAAGYRGIIAIHNTRLGPAVGGTRYWRYPSEQAALEDALRLSQGMSYKNALAGLPFGGGKGVIFENGRADRSALFEAHARFIDRLNGTYITAEDVGTTVADMETMRRVTPHVAGLSSGAGDPSPYTAHGVVRAIQACLQHRRGFDSLQGRTVAIQGLGSVGSALARELRALGADLLVNDVVRERTQRAVAELNACAVADIVAAQADVFAPCALGGVLNAESIPRLGAQIVAGAANNQLATLEDGETLEQRGVTYCPDFVANAGGVLSGAADILGWPMSVVNHRIEAIYDTVRAVLRSAQERGQSASTAAVALAEHIMATGSGRSDPHPLEFDASHRDLEDLF